MTSETMDAPVRAGGLLGTAAWHATRNVPLAAPATVIQDLLSILIYFAAAAALLS